MAIRLYRPADHAEWQRMRSALWPDQTAEDSATWLARPDAAVIVAEREPHGLCGFAEVGERSVADGCLTSPVAYLEGWYVDADVRRRGVGAALVRAVEEWAASRGYRELASDTELHNVVSQRAHERLGFAEVDRVVEFRKALAPEEPGMSPDARQVVWRRLDHPGHELARFVTRADGTVHLGGTAVLAYAGAPTLITYDIVCDAGWRTREARIRGRRGDAAFDLLLTADADGQWARNGTPLPAVEGCIDIDLGFTPSTNTLPIRRLALPVGGAAPVRAAWVRFPELSVQVLEQVYRRTAADRYIYESNGGAFRAELTVDDFGLVTNYPNLWISEGATR